MIERIKFYVLNFTAVAVAPLNLEPLLPIFYSGKLCCVTKQRTIQAKKYYPTCSNYITTIFKFLRMKKTSNTIIVLSLWHIMKKNMMRIIDIYVCVSYLQ